MRPSPEPSSAFENTSSFAACVSSVRADMIQRTTIEGHPASGPAKMWRFGSALRKIQSISSSKDEKWHRHHPNQTDSETNDSLNPKSPDTSSASNSLLESSESNFRQLQAFVQRMRSAPSGPNHVDAAYKEHHKIKDQCAALCRAILQDELRRGRDVAHSELSAQRHSFVEPPRTPSALYETRSSFSGRSLAEVVTGSVGKGHVPTTSDSWLGVIRDWKNCVETLADNFKTSLADTYRTYEPNVSQEMVDLLFANKRFRKEAVHRMRNASVTRVMSADPQYFPRYEIRFRNYERVKQELIDIRNILQCGESGISLDRRIDEYAIAPRGDAVLEFSNNTADSGGNDPVLRFRVSSHMLSETSPIFARMFSGQSGSLVLHDDNDISVQLPSPPTKYFCKDGSEAKLYRMPQRELNKFHSLEILFHAAHMHNDHVPREVSFEQFVAIAECCMRYRSTSPLELMVEHRWLPQWMHKGADDMPDGLLVISYAFGTRGLFTRMSKTAILNVVDEKELKTKLWPQKIKDKIWAVRCAKVAQLNACCINTVQEYLRPGRPRTPEQPDTPPLEDATTPTVSTMPLTSTPRCPKGSHWCDATNLGWLMLVYNEMNLLPYIMRPTVLTHLPESQPQPRSLAQIVHALRRIPSPQNPVHRGGVCDPGPTFRAAVNDIYNSVSGLTLFDISGKSHGWALSRHRERNPQSLLSIGLGGMATVDTSHSIVTEFPESVRLRIFCEMDDLDDLHAAARTNRTFYDTYKKHELFLMRNILRLDRKKAGTLRRPITLSLSHAEDKVLKTESDVIKASPGGDGTDAVTLRSDDEGDEEDEDYSDCEEGDDRSLYSSIAPSSLSRSVGTGSFISPRPDQRGPGDPLRIRTGSPPVAAAPPPSPPQRQAAAPTPSPSAGSPTTPRQRAVDQRPREPSSAVRSTDTSTKDIDEPPLTEEEARRILWPEEAIEATTLPIITPPPGVEGIREKFRVGDPALTYDPEEKTLVPTGDKQLRSDHDQRIGLLKSKGDALENGTGEASASGK